MHHGNRESEIDELARLIAQEEAEPAVFAQSKEDLALLRRAA